jgi:hypothetical protein
MAPALGNELTTYSQDKETTMNLHTNTTTDTEEFDFSATYGTAVFLLQPVKPGGELFGSQAGPRIGHLADHGNYLERHPKAA